MAAVIGLRQVLGLVLCLLSIALAGTESPGKFGFQSYPPGPDQGLGTASRPVPDGKGGFWFRNQGAIWKFDADGYRPLGPQDGLPEAAVEVALPEPTTGMWFRAQGSWYHLGGQGLERVSGVPATGAAEPSYLVLRNEGFAVVQDGQMRIFTGRGDAPRVLPSPGPGTWVKGWKDPRSQARLLVGDPGLARWDGRTWKLQPLRGFLDGRAWDVQRDGSGALWVRSDRDLVRVEPAPARFGPRLGFTRNSFVSLEEDGFGRMWTNGPEGLACIDGDQVWRIGEREGLYGHQAYWPIVFDPEGSLWTISSGGFQRMKGGFLWSVQEQAHGLPRAMIFTITRPARDGRLYAGSHDGLFRHGPDRWQPVPGTEHWALFGLAERANGELWTGGNPPWQEQASLLRIRPGRAAAQPAIEGLPSGLWTLALQWQGPNTLWCGTRKGLYRIEASGERFQAQRQTLPGVAADLPVSWLSHSGDGTLWAATGQGLFRLEGSTWKAMGRSQGLAADDAVGTFAGPGQEWWVLHDASKAITRLGQLPDHSWKVLGQFGPGHPLTRFGAQGGWTDPRGVVWILGHSEVVRWDGVRAEAHSKAFGVPLTEFFPNSLFGQADGRFWIGTISGLIAFDPRFYRAIPAPPALAAGLALDAGGRPFPPGASLPYRKAGISFKLPLALVDGIEDLQVKTRLLGLDDEWRNLSGSVLRFPALPPGRYTLQAKTVRKDGQEGPALRFGFRILRPWYLRGWALTLWGLSGALALIAVTQARTWAMRRERLRLEALVAARTLDLTQAHETVSQALAEVRTLRGLVPICCYCKSIRDDDGYWNQIERYVQEHSHARFSHGICPDCAQKAREELERDGPLSDQLI